MIVYRCDRCGHIEQLRDLMKMHTLPVAEHDGAHAPFKTAGIDLCATCWDVLIRRNRRFVLGE